MISLHTLFYTTIIEKILAFLGITSIGSSTIYYYYMLYKYGKKTARKILKLVKKMITIGVVLLILYIAIKFNIIYNLIEFLNSQV
jgi:hypothetical protein